MTHLAIDSRLLEFHIVDVETAAFRIAQLAGMAHGTNCLVASRSIEPLPGARVSALASRAVNHLPEINPLLVQKIVLHRENMNFTVGKFRGISLLEF